MPLQGTGGGGGGGGGQGGTPLVHGPLGQSTIGTNIVIPMVTLVGITDMQLIKGRGETKVISSCGTIMKSL